MSPPQAVGQEPAQHAFDAGQEALHQHAVARVAPEVPDRAHPVERPLRDGDGHGLDVSAGGHGQHAVGPRRVRQLRVPAREAPVGVGGEVHHLVDDRVADPAALLARRAVEVGVVCGERDGAEAHLVDALELGIAAREGRARRHGVEALVHLEAADAHGPRRPAHGERREAHAERVEAVEDVVAPARDVAEPDARRAHQRVVPDLLAPAGKSEGDAGPRPRPRAARARRRCGRSRRAASAWHRREHRARAAAKRAHGRRAASLFSSASAEATGLARRGSAAHAAPQ
jgi:hypothetical protein